MKRGLIADPTDNVGMVLETVEPGDAVDFGGIVVTARDRVNCPGKLALCDIPQSGEVRKFGGVIGCAVNDIPQGAWVHSHNLASGTKKEG